MGEVGGGDKGQCERWGVGGLGGGIRGSVKGGCWRSCWVGGGGRGAV